MTRLLSGAQTAQAMIIGVVIVGCATAATITGHLTGEQLLATCTLVGGGAVGVTGAHVGANAATASPSTPEGQVQAGTPPVAAAPTPTQEVTAA